MRSWRAAAAAGFLTLALAVPPSGADHVVGHMEPLGPAPARFPAGFPALVDSEWGFTLGGFGGRLPDDAEYGVVHPAAPPDRPPLIFVHGNTTDAADWYPVRDAFIAAGWDADDLWALSYNGVGSQSGTDGTPNPRRDDEHLAYPGYDFGARITANDVNVADLDAFIRAVRKHTGSKRFAVVAHSLGVTVARKTLKVHPDLRRHLAVFVAIAGGNHGTSLCPPGSEDALHSCDEVATGSRWLSELNGPNGRDETYRPAEWLTVYDGTGYMDVAYLGPEYAASPQLEGADNRALADNHNDLRIAPASIAVYRTWLEGVLDR